MQKCRRGGQLAALRKFVVKTELAHTAAASKQAPVRATAATIRMNKPVQLRPTSHPIPRAAAAVADFYDLGWGRKRIEEALDAAQVSACAAKC